MPANAIDRVAALPGMDVLLPALRDLPPAHLVGGAVRDLLLGAGSVDLDVAVDADAAEMAATLAERLGGQVKTHERFGTATVVAGGLRVDLAGTRRESYERPGALPVVERAPLADDLARRDFTINAMAIALSGEAAGAVEDPHGGRADLAGRVVRVLHDGSFRDDPTRLLRAVRYEARLGFRMNPHTEELAAAARTQGALATVSGARLGVALLDVLGEVEVGSAVARLGETGVGHALNPNLDLDAEVAAAAALACAEVGADRRLAVLAALVRGDVGAGAWVGSLGLDRGARERVVRAAAEGQALADELRARELPPSALRERLDALPEEALALALGLGAPGEPVLRYLSDLRGVRLEIGGGDLLAAGLPESEAIGRALAETLRRKLDGRVTGREEELQTAVALARGEKPA